MGWKTIDLTVPLSLSWCDFNRRVFISYWRMLVFESRMALHFLELQDERRRVDPAARAWSRRACAANPRGRGFWICIWWLFNRKWWFWSKKMMIFFCWKMMICIRSGHPLTPMIVWGTVRMVRFYWLSADFVLILHWFCTDFALIFDCVRSTLACRANCPDDRRYDWWDLPH